MNINSNYGLAAFQNMGKIGVQSPAPTTTTSVEPKPLATSASPSEQVTISSAARELAARADCTAPRRTAAQEQFLAAATNDTDTNVDRLAQEMAYAPSQVMYDLSHGDVRLSSTGQPVSDDYIANFNKLASVIDSAQRALYDSEKAKGTDPREILAKIVDFRNSQSDVYREATGLGRA